MSETENNPLLEMTFRIPFDRIDASHVKPAVDRLLADAGEKLAAAAKAADPLMAIDKMTERLDYAIGITRHLESVATTPALRAAHNAIQPKASAFYSSIAMNADLWQALQRYAASGDAKALTGTKRRFLTKTMDSFRRHGAELDAAGKAKLQELEVKLAAATTKFSENVLDATNAWELIVTDAAQLKGLPPAAVSMAKASAESKSVEGWRFTLQAPSYMAVMTYLDDASIREKMWLAYNRRAGSGEFDNRGKIAEILELRNAKARLLGYKDFADLVLEDRMAHTGATAAEFLEDLRIKSEPRYREENQELEQFAGKKMEPWDVGYYAEKQRAALYDFDEEALRPYFPMKSVVDGMFQIFGRLLGIEVRQEEGVPVWDPGVLTYAVYDAASKAHLGSFYADWYPRESKRGGAWMDSLMTGNPADPSHPKPHLGLICGNLTPPVDGKPALLTHREAETIFHEFGHLLHHLLSRVEVRSLSGTSVPWDFVELPSQIMENWCWEREALDEFARHWETGAPVPEDLFQKMKRAKTFRAANMQMRQLGFGVMDLKLHREWSGEDVIAFTRGVLAGFSAAELPDDYSMITGFTHLFASPVGYGAGYYSYKWAEVLDADAFTRFRKEGVFSEKVGREYRDKILAKGDSVDPAELYKSFMGRDPDPSALLERAGLA